MKKLGFSLYSVVAAMALCAMPTPPLAAEAVTDYSSSASAFDPPPAGSVQIAPGVWKLDVVGADGGVLSTTYADGIYGLQWLINEVLSARVADPSRASAYDQEISLLTGALSNAMGAPPGGGGGGGPGGGGTVHIHCDASASGGTVFGLVAARATATCTRPALLTTFAEAHNPLNEDSRGSTLFATHLESSAAVAEILPCGSFASVSITIEGQTKSSRHTFTCVKKKPGPAIPVLPVH